LYLYPANSPNRFLDSVIDIFCDLSRLATGFRQSTDMNWNYAYTPHIWPSVFTILLLTVLAVYSWHRREMPGALWLVIYCLLGLAFLGAKVIEFLAVDLDTKIFWFNVGQPWWLPGTTALTCFVLEYTWPGRWVTRRNIVLLSIVPVLGLVLVFTNSFHYLSYRGYGFTGDVVPLYGTIGWGLVVYNLGLRVISVIALTWLFVRSPQHRWPAALILLAETVVGAVIVLDPYIEESMFFYVPEKAIPVVACAIALFGFHIFDPIPLARQTVIEQMQAGMLVLDLKGRVVSLNPAAERILNAPAKQVKGKLVKELLPAYPEKLLADSGETEIELSFGENTSLRHYMLTNSMMKDFRGLEVGRLLLLGDVTEQKRVQAQILEQQRALSRSREREQLGRELHDNLGQVFAFVNIQGQTIHRLLSRGDLSTADEYVCRLLDVTREADVDIRESIMGLRATISEHGLLPSLKQYLAKYERNYGIQTQLEGCETFADGTFEPQVELQLLRILQEALTNVRKHSNAHSVLIAFALEDGWAKVTIHDDGRGFEPDGSFVGMEEHVGLRVMHERAEEVGGNLSVQSTLGQGTELYVRVPVKGSNHA
jgi:PAS domain S-box-containing protein